MSRALSPFYSYMDSSFPIKLRNRQNIVNSFDYVKFIANFDGLLNANAYRNKYQLLIEDAFVKSLKKDNKNISNHAEAYANYVFLYKTMVRTISGNLYSYKENLLPDLTEKSSYNYIRHMVKNIKLDKYSTCTGRFYSEERGRYLTKFPTIEDIFDDLKIILKKLIIDIGILANSQM
jgi:hypothetical protein